MDAIVKLIQGLELHPVTDHFTVALFTIGVLTDLVGSLAPTRTWIRYTALTLMILGAISAGASLGTGSLEAERVWKRISPDAQHVLHLHAEFGKYLAITFGVLALWRILIQAVGFASGSRPLYLLIAVLSCGALLYAGSLGGELVYTYGVGTALMSPASTPTAETSPGATPTLEVPTEALPTVSVPIPTATPRPKAPPSVSPSSVTPEASPKPSGSPAAHPSPAASLSASPSPVTPEASPEPSGSPTARPSPETHRSPEASARWFRSAACPAGLVQRLGDRDSGVYPLHRRTWTA